MDLTKDNLVASIYKNIDLSKKRSKDASRVATFNCKKELGSKLNGGRGWQGLMRIGRAMVK